MIRFLIRIAKSPQVLFIWSILTKWYILILIPTIMATYYVFRGLNEAGIFAMIEHFTLGKLQMVVNIARECTPEILELKRFFTCIHYVK